MTDKYIKGFSGYFMIVIQAALFGLAGYVLSLPNLGAVSMLILFIDLVLIRGYFVTHQGEAVLLSLMGKYKGTIDVAGFYWSHPFRSIKRVSLKDHVNMVGPWETFAKDGVQLEVSIELRWKVEDAAKAQFGLSNIKESVSSIAKETAQTLIEMYPYEDLGKERVSLRLHSNTISSAYATALKKKLLENGLYLESARFNGVRQLSKKRSTEDAVSLAQQMVQEVDELNQLSESEKADMKLQLLTLLMTEK
ncbi:SPFH domain-containing protein [Flammeovirga kamogawensis]|uniref:Band 7 domain-containing protein n=1 Tax=Flammeovirga kamogawensis TaxID=373891 RepID=A0ABX8GSU8_9BACT|nr:SPFH domain-containing protein [Flammeovirga kamogawensis]MBB6463358.1 regulator of protease activity HflC (stomatin/prohibitin superfamily) [Flammeovirga kamogawensis]QWG06670.1 hypothetical protein KM029_15340 [Flammeovirga kamogawensis]TRX68492.1 hypothetical protein EO216_10335 [Flammeovirga kamogawensis]